VFRKTPCKSFNQFFNDDICLFACNPLPPLCFPLPLVNLSIKFFFTLADSSTFYLFYACNSFSPGSGRPLANLSNKILLTTFADSYTCYLFYACNPFNPHPPTPCSGRPPPVYPSINFFHDICRQFYLLFIFCL
jgi:hypothetical protein